MLKHLSGADSVYSLAGTAVTGGGFTIYYHTLSAAALFITIITGLTTTGYTIYKWRKDIKKSAN